VRKFLTIASSIHRYFGSEIPHPAIPAMGSSQQKKARSGIDLHHHSHYEVLLLKEGTLDWEVDQESISLTPGTLLLTREDERHGSKIGIVQPSLFLWIQIDPAPLKPHLKKIIKNISWRTVPYSSKLLSTLESILNETQNLSLDSHLLTDGLLTQFIVELSRSRPKALKPSNSVQKVVVAIQANPQHPWSNSELEALGNMGHTQLNKLFQREIGMSPHTYALRERLRYAHLKLRESDISITNLAYDCGFSNSQHLASCFRKYFGMTPSDCRNEKGL